MKTKFEFKSRQLRNDVKNEEHLSCIVRRVYSHVIRIQLFFLESVYYALKYINKLSNKLENEFYIYSKPFVSLIT